MMGMSHRALGPQFDPDGVGPLAENMARSLPPEDARFVRDAVVHRQKAREGLVAGSGPINDQDASLIGASHLLHAHLEDAGWSLQRSLSRHARGATVHLGERVLERPPHSYDPDIPATERHPTESYTDMVTLTPNDDGTVHARLSQPHWDWSRGVEESTTLRGLPHTSSDLSAFVSQYYDPSLGVAGPGRHIR